MTRLPIGPALPVLALGLAAVLVAPSLRAGVEGEPIRVVANPPPAVQLANFEGEACATALARGGSAADLRVVTVTLGSEGEQTTIDLEEVEAEAVAPDATLVLLLDAEGRLIAAGDAGALTEDSARATLAGDCHDEKPVHGAI